MSSPRVLQKHRKMHTYTVMKTVFTLIVGLALTQLPLSLWGAETVDPTGPKGKSSIHKRLTAAGRAKATPNVRTRIKPSERKRAIEQHNRDLFQRHDKDHDGVLDEQESDALWTEWRVKLNEKKAGEAAARNVSASRPSK